MGTSGKERPGPHSKEKTMATTEAAPSAIASKGEMALGRVTLSILRIMLGFVFFWAFIDKAFGLGFSTCRDGETGAINYMCEGGAWFNGGKPTYGFLAYASGDLSGEAAGVNGSGAFFAGWAEANIGGFRYLDWLFMLGLLAIGTALILGIGTKVAAWACVLMSVFMYIAAADLVTNPILDHHVFYAVTGVAVAYAELEKQSIGLGTLWRKLPIVQKWTWLV